MNSPLLETSSKKSRWPRQLVRVLLVLLLVGGLITAFFLIRQESLPYDLKDYQKAVEAGDHDKVLAIYHALRSKRAALADAEPSERIQALEAAADQLIDRMERDAGRKSQDLIASLTEGASLTEADLDWMEDYAAMAGHYMTQALSHQLGRYLAHEFDQASFIHFAGQLTRLPYLARDSQALVQEADLLEAVKEGLKEANEARDRGALYEESKILTQIMAAWDLSRLEPARLYLEDRLSLAWEGYYQEEIAVIRQEMARDKTYDAAVRIKRLLAWFQDDQELLAFYDICQAKNPDKVVTWWDPVEHLAIKPLIADSQRAFDGDKYQAAADRDLLLTGEFEKILFELYDRDYVLVDSRAFVSPEGRLQGIVCPQGKKPLVLVLEDYYASLPRAESGIAWRLQLNEDDRIEGVLLDADGSERADPSFTALGILEAFLESHPDFSFNGARGVIALVGQYGILGYPVADVQELTLRRDARDSGLDPDLIPRADFAYNRQVLDRLLQALQARNWTLASGSYARLSLPFSSLALIDQDIAMTAQWMEHYTGKLEGLYCPFGDHLESDPVKTARYTQAGYSLQSGYGAWAYWQEGDGYAYVSRTYVSGSGLRQPWVNHLDRFFDAARVLDRQSRP